MKGEVYLIARIQAREQFIGAPGGRQLAAPGGLHCFDRLGVRPAVVVSSPLLRARQTASGLLQNWEGTPPELRIEEELAPGGKKPKMAKLLRALNAGTVALVGHMPDLGLFAAWLIGSKKARIEFAKAGAAYFVSDTAIAKGGATIEWMITPDVCAVIA